MHNKISANGFPAEVADQLIKSDKVEASPHLSKLINMRYNSKENIREYIMKMSDLVSKLKVLKLELSEEIQLHFILISFLIKYNPFFKIIYNAQRERWSLTELISYFVWEEERLKKKNTGSAHFVFQDNTSNKKRKSVTKGTNMNTTTVANLKWQRCMRRSLRSLHTFL